MFAAMASQRLHGGVLEPEKSLFACSGDPHAHQLHGFAGLPVRYRYEPRYDERINNPEWLTALIRRDAAIQVKVSPTWRTRSVSTPVTYAAAAATWWSAQRRPQAVRTRRGQGRGRLIRRCCPEPPRTLQETGGARRRPRPQALLVVAGYRRIEFVLIEPKPAMGAGGSGWPVSWVALFSKA